MRRLINSLIIFILIGGIILTAYAPDEVSTVFIVLMEAIVFLGVMFGLLPVLQFSRAFEHGMENIERALEVQTSSTWSVMIQIEDFFHQRAMDDLFREYQEKVQSQRNSGQVLSDVEDYINEDVLGLKSWQSVITQIPGTLTGLGILGTFIGLIIGIQGIGFSSVNAALSSVQTLLSGIQVAFYTSIAGVILSLLFNIVYRITWNMLLHNLGLFTEEFHKNVIPPVEEQLRYRERKEIKQITDLLERLPKSGSFSVSNGGGGLPSQSAGSEQILMPQILQGLKDGEFMFHLQPRYDLNNRHIVGAEALVRWNHGKLGMVSPAVFIPVLESNGYITKLDQYIWEQVCATIRRWIDSGIRPVPITINVTKTDIMAMDIVEFFNGMLKKYRIPPRQLEIDIAENAYMQAGSTALETEEKLRQAGFKVSLDGFDGNFIALSAIEGMQADVLKLDLRHYPGNNNQGALNGLFEQARKLQFTVIVEGIESMEQMGMLRKCGCSEGQGFFMHKPTSVEEFEKLLTGEKKAQANQEDQKKKPKRHFEEEKKSEEPVIPEKAAEQPNIPAFAAPLHPPVTGNKKPENPSEAPEEKTKQNKQEETKAAQAVKEDKPAPAAPVQQPAPEAKKPVSAPPAQAEASKPVMEEEKKNEKSGHEEKPAPAAPVQQPAPEVKKPAGAPPAQPAVSKPMKEEEKKNEKSGQEEKPVPAAPVQQPAPEAKKPAGAPPAQAAVSKPVKEEEKTNDKSGKEEKPASQPAKSSFAAAFDKLLSGHKKQESQPVPVAQAEPPKQEKAEEKPPVKAAPVETAVKPAVPEKPEVIKKAEPAIPEEHKKKGKSKDGEKKKGEGEKEKKDHKKKQSKKDNK